MVDKNDPLFREVDEELRREQMAKLWEKYGVYVIAAASLIVAFVGGFKFWESRQLALAQEAGGAEYEAARQLSSTGKADEAAKAFEAIAQSGQAGYAALAELTLAGSQLKAGRPQDALAIFEKLAKDPSADPLLSSFAAVQAASLRLGDADFAEMQNRLNPLARRQEPLALQRARAPRHGGGEGRQARRSAIRSFAAIGRSIGARDDPRARAADHGRARGEASSKSRRSTGGTAGQTPETAAPATK